jgi:hypothetical protein
MLHNHYLGLCGLIKSSIKKQKKTYFITCNEGGTRLGSNIIFKGLKLKALNLHILKT